MRTLNSNSTTRTQEQGQEGGAVVVIVALALVGLLAFAAVALDGGYMTATRGQLQHVADSGALASITAVRDGLTQAEAIALAKQTTEDSRHEAGGDPVQLAASDIEFGTFDLASGTFSPGLNGTGISAFRVTARRERGSGARALDLFFAGVSGFPQADIVASSVAAVRRRDLVVVQDRTHSFSDEFSDAIDADIDLVNAMSGGLTLSGDRVGVVSFSRVAQEELALTELATRHGEVIRTLNNMTVCPNSSASIGCNGTGTADAIDAAVDIFTRDSLNDDAEKIMVLVTDGVPCHAELWPGDMIGPAKIAATAAADNAVAAGINMYVISLVIDDGKDRCFTPGEAYGASLAGGFGYGVSTPDANDLDDLLLSIVSQMPVRLVQ